MAEMKSPNAHAKKNRNDTPRKRKTHIIKVRVTAEEKLRIAYACKELHLTQSELVRRVLYGVNVKHTVVVAQGGEDALAALAALSAQCSKVGSNLNQLARHFNSGGKDTEQLRAQILEELSALTNFRHSLSKCRAATQCRGRSRDQGAVRKTPVQVDKCNQIRRVTASDVYPHLHP